MTEKLRNDLTRKERKELARRLRADAPGLEVVHPNAAAIDMGNSAHYVAVAPSRDPEPVRRFGCFTEDLQRMAEWLRRCGIHTVRCRTGCGLHTVHERPNYVARHDW